jgi:predicted TIM-barrel fold metal-dependent hydrolase
MPLPDDAQIISVDDHVIEHPRVWLDRVPSKFGDAIPRIERMEDGNDWWIYEGKKAGNFALNAVAGKPREEFGLEPRTYDDMRPGCHDIHERVKDMDIEGVWAEVAFPNMPGFAGRVFEESTDMELALACTRAYNDWILDEWCAAVPGRQIPVVILPYWDIDASVKELQRTAEKGARSYSFLELPHMRGFPSYHTDHWDPLLAATQEANMAISVHFGSTGASDMIPPEGGHGGGVNINRITVMGLNSAFAMTQMLTSKMFLKFPKLRFALSEGGIGWMPYLLERIDYVWDRHRWYNDINREIPPSELFKDHIFGCFIYDDAGIEARHRIGVDQIMFESDYPHSDSNWPHTRKMLAASLTDVPDDEARKIVELNARRVYNWPRTTGS